MKKYFLILFFIAVSLLACNDAGKKKEGKTTQDDSEVTNSKAQILNNIIVHEKGGLEIARAFLSNENGELISPKNTTDVGAPVYLNLIIKKGWIAENGKVSLGVSEKIETAAGEVILNAPDLFKDTASINEADANILSLKAVIKRTLPDIKYYVVHYRAWDKKGDGEVNGRYQLYVQ